ncbi:DNA repair protein rad50 [Cichlidogyrus casuarinus]|uniref:DNA repair protein rad50 n=1 Tax=Cichlidogyrus casuarinus TaxID=1844966 RepID=A0ABD2QDX9_9PLAT
MSSLLKMSIQGVRSFGPDKSQLIEFESPLTLILGPNGTGKTTIIECLKYVTIGELPSGSKVGATFIYDPKLVHETEIKAKVSIQFSDTKSRVNTISRSMVATIKDDKKPPTMKSLDASMKCLDPNGKITSISSRCTEIGQEVVSRLGVSKSVIENVIFCHQEDSNWPLQEAKFVKQKFDDLFAASRYVKALDAVRKCKQDQDSKVKQFTAELRHLQRNCDEAKKTKKEASQIELNIKVETDALEKLKNDLDPITNEIEQVRKKFDEFVKLENDLKFSAQRKEECENLIKNLLQNITKEFDGSDQELQISISNAEELLENRKKASSQKETDISVQERDISRILTKKEKLQSQLTEFRMIIKNQQEATEKRTQIFTKHYPLFHEGSTVASCEVEDDYKAKRVLSGFESVHKERMQSLEKNRSDLEAEEKKIQTWLNEVSNEAAKLDQQLKSTKENLRAKTEKMKSLERRLQSASDIQSRIDQVKLKLSEAVRLNGAKL